MKRLLAVLWLPLTLGLLNVIAYYVLRDPSEGVHWLDVASIVISVAVVFFAGWAAARKLDRLGPAILAAVLIWLCSAALLLALIGKELLYESSSEALKLVVTGFVISVLVLIPVVIGVSTLGAVLSRRMARS